MEYFFFSLQVNWHTSGYWGLSGVPDTIRKQYPSTPSKNRTNIIRHYSPKTCYSAFHVGTHGYAHTVQRSPLQNIQLVYIERRTTPADRCKRSAFLFGISVPFTSTKHRRLPYTKVFAGTVSVVFRLKSKRCNHFLK